MSPPQSSGYGLNYDGHCRKCPPFPITPGGSTATPRPNAPFDAQGGCSGCGVVTVTSTSFPDGSDGHTTAVGPVTGDLCGTCSPGFYNTAPLPSPVVGCAARCLEESTTKPPGVLASSAYDVSICTYCQAGYYPTTAASSGASAICTLCPGNSTTAAPTTGTGGANTCIYCKTGYFISALATSNAAGAGTGNSAATCTLCPHHTTTPDPAIFFALPPITAQGLYVTQLRAFALGPEDPAGDVPTSRALRSLTAPQTSFSLADLACRLDEPVLQDAGVCSCCLEGYELLAPASEVGDTDENTRLRPDRTRADPLITRHQPPKPCAAPAAAGESRRHVCVVTSLTPPPPCVAPTQQRVDPLQQPDVRVRPALPLQVRLPAGASVGGDVSPRGRRPWAPPHLRLRIYAQVSDPWSCNCVCPVWPVDLTDSSNCRDGDYIPLGSCGCRSCPLCPPYKVRPPAHPPNP